MTRDPIPCVVIAGGRSSRFGGAKGLAPFADTTLLDFVVKQIARRADGPIGINTARDGPYADYPLPIIPDQISGQVGPLAGLHAAMIWASDLGFERVFTIAVDMPFLPEDWADRLAKTPGNAVASDRGGRYSICGLWATDQVGKLEQEIDGGLRALQAWCGQVDVTAVPFEKSDSLDPLFNINKQDDLNRAKAMLAAQSD